MTKKLAPAKSAPAAQTHIAREVSDASSDEVDQSDDEYDDDDKDDDDDDEDDEGSEEDVLDTDASNSDDDEFEQQSSSGEEVSEDDLSEEDIVPDKTIRRIPAIATKRNSNQPKSNSKGNLSNTNNANNESITTAMRATLTEAQKLLHVDDMSSDDEEAEGNTIGRVPLHWYDAYDHIGYDVSGEKVVKRKGMDRLDLTIANRDENTKHTVYDMYNDRHVTLSDREMELIRRIQAGAFAHPEHDDTPDYIDYYSSKIEQMPLTGAPEPKRRFTPSKWELMRVMKIVKAMKEGRYKTQEELKEEKKVVKETANQYMIWQDGEDEILAESSRRLKFHLPAPKMALPGHEESYNPPDEYLLTPEEITRRITSQDDYLELESDEVKKQLNKHPTVFIPKKFSCLRHISGYEHFVRERYERCLD